MRKIQKTKKTKSANRTAETAKHINLKHSAEQRPPSPPPHLKRPPLSPNPPKIASLQRIYRQRCFFSSSSSSSSYVAVVIFFLLLRLPLPAAMDGEISEEFTEIASDYDDEAAPARVTPGAAQRRRLSKPNKGTRFLAILLQALVMAAALFLFFLFAGIAAVLLLHLFVAGRSLRRRRRRLGGAGTPRAGGLSQEELRRLPSCRYSGKGRGESADCVVCLEGVRAGERWRMLPACGHGFHKACVDRWLMRATACPVCRAGVRAC